MIYEGQQTMSDQKIRKLQATNRSRQTLAETIRYSQNRLSNITVQRH